MFVLATDDAYMESTSISENQSPLFFGGTLVWSVTKCPWA
jgi:hypothetical protein